MPMYGTCSKYGIPRGHISRWHFGHFPSILHAPTFCIHVNQSTPHKDIQIPSNLNNLLMRTSFLFKSKNTGTCIQHSNKGNRFGCTPSWFICQNSSSKLCPCPHFRYPNIMVVHHLKMASCWTLSKHPQCAPTFWIHVNHANPNKDISLATILNDLLMNTPASSSTATLAHELSIPTKVTESSCPLRCCLCWNSSSVSYPCPHFTHPNIMVVPVTTFQNGILMKTFQVLLNQHMLITWTEVNLSGLIPCSICWKSCIAFSGHPPLTYFVSFLFHGKIINCTIPGAIAAISAATHGEFCWSSSQSASCVFICLKSGYFSFAYL